MRRHGRVGDGSDDVFLIPEALCSWVMDARYACQDSPTLAMAAATTSESRVSTATPRSPRDLTTPSAAWESPDMIASK